MGSLPNRNWGPSSTDHGYRCSQSPLSDRTCPKLEASSALCLAARSREGATPQTESVPHASNSAAARAAVVGSTATLVKHPTRVRNGSRCAFSRMRKRETKQQGQSVNVCDHTDRQVTDTKAPWYWQAQQEDRSRKKNAFQASLHPSQMIYTQPLNKDLEGLPPM